jgi:plastocyanin
MTQIGGPNARCLLLTAATLLSGSTMAGTPTVASFNLEGTVSVGQRPDANAVVWLDAPNQSALPQKTHAVLDQRNLAFHPHVLAVRTGTIVDLPNNDRVFHNVFSFHDGKRFDLGLYPVGTVRHVTFDKPGMSRIFCNIHQNMTAYVMAVATPYFTVSNDDGRFTIAAVAPGTYTYHAWRPGRPDVTGSAVIGAGRTLDIRWR